MLEAVAIIAGFYDVAVMGQSIQQGGGHLRITEHRRPFREAEIGGDQDAGSFVELADQVEEKRTTSLTEGQVPQFIKYYQVRVHQAVGQTALIAGQFLLFQGVDQLDGR